MKDEKEHSLKVSVAILGARMHYAIPRILSNLGILCYVYTDLYIGNKPRLLRSLAKLSKFLRVKGLDRILGRSEDLPPERVVSFDFLGIAYAIRRRLAQSNSQSVEIFERYGKKFNRHVLRAGLRDADVVWGFNTASLEIFEHAKADGRFCILEQTILPSFLEHEIMSDVMKEFGAWQPRLSEPSLKLHPRESLEWRLADVIVTGSQFVATGLAKCGVAEDKIRVIPYGVDPTKFQDTRRLAPNGRPLRLLFVGEVGIRKGAPILLLALERLVSRNIKARFAGGIALSPAIVAAHSSHADFLGAVPRNAIHEHFAWADVLVLPTFVEGSATVTYEAMLSELATITTENAGSLVENNISGQIIATNDVDALVAAIARYDDNREVLATHQTNAVKIGRSKASFARYEADVEMLMTEIGKQIL